MRHVPVLLEEVLYHTRLEPGMTVVDATFGRGGYTREIVRRIFPGGTLLAIDRDQKALDRGEKELDWKEILSDVREKEHIHFAHANYSQLDEVMQEYGLHQADAIVADLGISSEQLDDTERGISFLKEAPLDMRLDQSEDVPTAYFIVNTWDEKRLAKMFRENAQQEYAEQIASFLVEKRKKEPLRTTRDLVGAIEEVHAKTKPGIHVATKVFQALRMEVNKETDHLKLFLDKAITMLSPGGRLAVVSFHSGEDRVVKEVFRENARGCICPTTFPLCRCGRLPRIRICTKKPLTPSLEEIKKNNRSRSAKLRVVEKLPI